MRSASSSGRVKLSQKAAYLARLFAMRIRGCRATIVPWDDFRLYSSITGEQAWKSSKILEIGYGARPWRLVSLISTGLDARGVDLDQPAIGFNIKRLIRAWKTNGFERFLKSSVRSLLFDTGDLRRLRRELAQVNAEPRWELDRFLVGNASDEGLFGESQFDFSYSEDVFEHIPGGVLPAIVKNMYRWLKPAGLAFVRPHVYSGIAGGHAPEFYPHSVVKGTFERSRAWEHLWNPDYEVNTYLNRWRLKDYYHLFEPYFEVLRLEERTPNLGAEYLTQEIELKLPGFSREELLMNQVGFVLKSRKR